MQAVLGRHFDTAQTLLDEGAAIDEREHAGRTPLFMAAVTGNAEGVEWLLDRGADVNAASDFGYTPLMAASTYAGTAEITDLLLKHGALLNTSIGVDALDLAIETGRLEAARVLIARWGELDATKLLGAAKARNIDMVRLLLASGADVNAPRPDGLMPLIISAMFNDVEIIDVFLAAGADVNAVTSNPEIVDITVASGADPTLLRVTGVTALTLAERNGNDALVQRLRDAGAYR
jgi:ankyrin repeat protein